MITFYGIESPEGQLGHGATICHSLSSKQGPRKILRSDLRSPVNFNIVHDPIRCSPKCANSRDIEALNGEGPVDRA